MEDLIKALQIFIKYDNPNYPTHCEHDELLVAVSPIGMSYDDLVELDKLGFFVYNTFHDGENGVGRDENGDIIKDFEYDDDDVFLSYKYGSC